MQLNAGRRVMRQWANLGAGQERGGEAAPAEGSEPAPTDRAKAPASGGAYARRRVAARNRAEQGCPGLREAPEMRTAEAPMVPRPLRSTPPALADRVLLTPPRSGNAGRPRSLPRAAHRAA